MKIEISKGVDIIGDIHACFDEFLEMLVKLGYIEGEDGLFRHPEGRTLVSLGDVMSRGPQSLRCMEFFLNHVNARLAYMTDSNHGWKIARWLDGRKVQLRHGDELVEQEFLEYEKINDPKKTKEFKRQLKELLMNAPSHYILQESNVDKIVCTHAGIKGEYIGKENSRIKDFCRYGDVAGTDQNGKPIRKDWFINHNNDLLIIWGHDPKREPMTINNTINIDQGLVFGGKLTTYRYPENEFVFVPAKKNYSGKEGNDNPIQK
ncbi:metallophosphoesterase [Ureibacillus manganicus]|uniref:Biotin transporter BioY n=1 Tax=Ureibacillus manganicus DSM 26584 TaxID=1384049 RepID=A0A0A3I498_9BACL|nr:metallophosphoesterase [Ureibacillus manganicus]KGR78310.1 biotin transporter BioY [Ureibacillus manganicus DSM 26584]